MHMPSFVLSNAETKVWQKRYVKNVKSNCSEVVCENKIIAINDVAVMLETWYVLDTIK